MLSYFDYKDLKQRLYTAVRLGNTTFILEVSRRINVSLPDEQGKTLLHYAAMWSKPDVVRFLLKELSFDAHIADHCKRTALHEASLQGDDKTVRLLLPHMGSHINPTDFRGCTPLHDAVIEGHFSVVDLLLSQPHTVNVNIINSFGKLPIDIAFENNRNDIVKRLKVEGAKLSDRNKLLKDKSSRIGKLFNKPKEKKETEISEAISSSKSLSSIKSRL